MGILAMGDSYLTETDKADLVSVLNKATGDYLSGTKAESLQHLNSVLNRLGIGSTDKHLQSAIKEKVEDNISHTQKGNASSKFGEHTKKEGQLTEIWNNTSQADKAAVQAEKDLLDKINSFTSKSQANKNATMVGAYDPVTGKTAIGSGNANITKDVLHSKTVEYIEKQLGVSIGEFTSFCKNKAGACAEVSAADQLIRQGIAPDRIKFTKAVKPRVVYQENKITQDAIIKPCENCQITWPKEK